MFSGYSGKWIPDAKARRRGIMRRTVDRLSRLDQSGERKVRIPAVGFPTVFSQARYG